MADWMTAPAGRGQAGDDFANPLGGHGTRRHDPPLDIVGGPGPAAEVPLGLGRNCRSVLPFIHFIPDLLRYCVPLFLER